MRLFTLFSCLLLSASSLVAQSLPKAIYTDPPADRDHLAKMSVLHLPSHGVKINGIVYQPSGAGAHPTAILLHGLPGNEKNLDLAQALRRAGWNAVTFNYRGSWGSPGKFSFVQNLEDADSVLAFLREPANAARFSVDTRRIVIIGHSMGGWIAAHTASHDHAVAGVVLISAADMGRMGELPRAKAVQELADDMESLSGVTPESMADELRTHAKDFRLENAVAGLTHTPMLVLSANDGLGPMTDAFVDAIRAKGGRNVTSQHVDTDHGWSDHRIALESTILQWLSEMK